MNPSERSKSHAWLMVTSVLVAIFVVSTVLYSLAQFWPYGETSASHQSGVISEKTTSDGIPVVFEGGTLRYLVDFCNSGVDVHTVRYLDSYGPLLAEDAETTNEMFASARLLSDISYNGDVLEGCAEDLEATVEFGFEIPTGGYYKLRTVNSYSPNPLSRRTYETETDLFYYAAFDEELP